MFKIGVYVDAENIQLNGGYGLRYDVLRKFAEREGGLVQRLNTYLAVDRQRMERDRIYRRKREKYLNRLRDGGWYVFEKAVKRFQDDEGNIVCKANADMELAIDTLVQSEKLDRILLVTGDGDFCRLIRALQDKGCRVEVVGFSNVSRDIKKSGDFFMSGYLIPGLLPVENGDRQRNGWYQEGARVRGVLVRTVPEKGYGFIRVLTKINARLWVNDNRPTNSPYEDVIVFQEDMPVGLTENQERELGIEFKLEKNPRNTDPAYIAKECKTIEL